MSSNFLAVFFGLASALIWGSGDFCGGLATRRASILYVLTVAEASGVVLLLGLAWFWHEPLPPLPILGWALGAGIMGMIGLACLYRGLAIGRAGLVAPTSAVIGATVPAIFSIITEGTPGALRSVGFGFALVAVWLVSQSETSGDSLRGFGLAIIAGCGFGLFFILIDQTSAVATYWPLIIARTIACLCTLLGILYYRMRWSPPPDMLPLALLSGGLDALGNAFFLLAAQTGRLDVAAILASLFPASTVILSRIFLGERLTWRQSMGVVAALAAIALISI